MTPRDVDTLRARLKAAAAASLRISRHLGGVTPPCSIEGCAKPVDTRGWCSMHYSRWRRTGDPLGLIRVFVPEGATCSIDGCEKQVYARGWCRMHYDRWRGAGDPLGSRFRIPKAASCSIAGCDVPVYARGWCHLHYKRWLAHGDPEAWFPGAARVDSQGYRFLPQVNGVRAYEHRAVLLAAIGPGEHPCSWCGVTVSWDADWNDPHQLVVDHLDEDKLNNDPANLLPSCSPCNARRSARGRPKLLVCARGHAMEGENLYVWNGQRCCKACRRVHDRARRLRESLALVAR